VRARFGRRRHRGDSPAPHHERTTTCSRYWTVRRTDAASAPVPQEDKAAQPAPLVDEQGEGVELHEPPTAGGAPFTYYFPLSAGSEPETFPIRAIEINGYPWLVAPDVCRVLKEHNVTKVIACLNDDEKSVSPFETSSGIVQRLRIINAYTVKTLTIRSDVPHAKTFRQWVEDNIIMPAFDRRVDGSYARTATHDATPEPEQPRTEPAPTQGIRIWEILDGRGLRGLGRMDSKHGIDRRIGPWRISSGASRALTTRAGRMPATTCTSC
jgi:hypothetical protein